MPARLSLVLLLLAAGAGTVLLAGRCDLGTADASAFERAETTEPTEPTAPLSPLPAETAPSRPEPTLQGRGVEPATRSELTGVRVRVVSDSGKPAPERNVIARWTTGEPPKEFEVRGKTGDDGEALLLEVPHDQAAQVSVWGHGGGPPRVAAEDPHVTGPALEVRLEALLEASLVYVDAESGRVIDDATTIWFDGAGFGDLVHAPRGELSGFDPFVDPPAGYLAWDDHDWTLGIGQWTRKVTAIYPLRRELEVEVTVSDHLGRPEPEATVEKFRVAGRTVVDHWAESSGVGRFRLRGVPFLQGEPLVVSVGAPYLRYPIVQEIALPHHPSDRTDLAIVLPPPGSQEKREPTTIGIGGGCSSRFCRGRGSFKKGTLEIRVLRHDGTPASGAMIKIGRRKLRLDANGAAHVEKISVGRHTVKTHTIGLLPISGSVVVEAGKTARLELREPRGGAIDVRVVDADGRPATCAELYVALPSGGHWVDERDGVQRIDPFVDHRGCRTLNRVETGTVKVRARWASRRGEVEVIVRADERSRATIVVR